MPSKLQSVNLRGQTVGGLGEVEDLVVPVRLSLGVDDVVRHLRTSLREQATDDHRQPPSPSELSTLSGPVERLRRVPLGSSSDKPTAAVFVDGFNLYRRLLAGQPQHKWLDLEALMDRVLADYTVTRIAYFTAVVKALPGKDIDSPQRQQAYLRALATLPRVEVFMGKFRVDPRIMPLHPTQYDGSGQPVRVTVKKTEEKGSDVALASQLLISAMRGDCDIYVVCTNDSDLVMPLRLAQEELGRDVGLLSPMEPKRSSNELKQTNPAWHRQITPADLEACQLPDEVRDGKGIVRRPAKWERNSEGPAEAGPSNQ